MTNIGIDAKYNQSLARVFSRSVLTELVSQNRSPYIDEILNSSGFIESISENTTYEDIFEMVYDYLLKVYRGEYVYKNAIANKILLGKHDLETSYMLMEFRVATCKADAVILNGTSNVYEIKSEFDSLDRLENQVKTYQKVFDMVHVIAASSQLEKVAETVDSTVGLMKLTKEGTIETRREAVSGRGNIQTDVIFDSLRMSERKGILRDKYGLLPTVPNTQAYKVYKELFCRLDPSEVHRSMVEVLKKRGDCSRLKEFVLGVPSSLKALALSSKLSKADFEAFSSILGRCYTHPH